MAAIAPTAEDKKVLRQRLKDAGLFERGATESWVKFWIVTALAMGALAVQPWLPTWLIVTLVPLTALFITAAVMFGHEGAHRSFSNSVFVNELVAHFYFPFVGGLGLSYWKYKHNVMHHGHPNIDGYDDDLDLWPMASTKRRHEESPKILQAFQRTSQKWAFWPLTTFLVSVMRLTSLQFLYGRAKEGKFGKAEAMDLTMLLGHYAAWVVVPVAVWGWGALAFYFGVWAFVGAYLSAIFIPGHLGLPVIKGDGEGWLLQMATSRSFRVPVALRWVFIGLDTQLEHHLYTKMPHLHLRRAAPIAREWALERGLPYIGGDLFPLLAEVTRHIGEAYKDEPVTLEEATEILEKRSDKARPLPTAA